MLKFSLTFILIIVISAQIYFQEDQRVYKDYIFKATNSFTPDDYDLFRAVIFIYNSKSGKQYGYDYSQKNKNTILDSGYIEADSEFIYYASQGRPIIKILIERVVSYRQSYLLNQMLEKIKLQKTEGDYKIEKRDKNFIYQSRGIGLFEDYIVVLYSGRKDAYGKTLDFYEKKILTINFHRKLIYTLNT